MAKKIKYCVILIFLLCDSTNTFSQFRFDKDKVIESLKGNIYNQYVSEEIAIKMCDSIAEFNKKGKYNNIISIDDFLYELTKDLRKISNDKHILITSNRKIDENIKTTRKAKFKLLKKKYTFKTVLKYYQKRLNKSLEDDFEYGDIKILPDNIGYVEIKEFNSILEENKKKNKRIALKDVMNFLKDTKSIIIDLRNNLGGDVFLAAKFSSYFSDEPNRYFATLESNGRYDSSGVIIRNTFKTECKTFRTINNESTKNKKIIILISNFTFSAGELTAYTIKKLNAQTTIIGTKTAGAGNVHSGLSDYYNYLAIIPRARLYDVENKNHNIEGVGVLPDIEVNSDSAVLTALNYLQLKEKEISNIKYFKKDIEYTISTYLKKHALEYVGDYNKVQIKYENEKLFMLYDNYNKKFLVQNEEYIFSSPEFKSINFIKNIHGEIIKIKIEHLEGYYEEFMKK